MNTDQPPQPEDSLVAVLPALLDAAGIARVTVETITRTPSFRGGSVSASAQEITGLARTEHRERGFGFWEFALERSLNADPETRRALMNGALAHAPARADERAQLSTTELANQLASGVWTQMRARTMVNLCSTVTTVDGSTAQLLLLDFGVPASLPASEDAAVDALDALGLTGALFTSGRSFHFVADQVMPGEQMRRALARAQLLSPIVDVRWVAHQLIDGECRLRISTDSERNTISHRLVRRL